MAPGSTRPFMVATWERDGLLGKRLRPALEMRASVDQCLDASTLQLDWLF